MQSKSKERQGFPDTSNRESLAGFLDLPDETPADEIRKTVDELVSDTDFGALSDITWESVEGADSGNGLTDRRACRTAVKKESRYVEVRCDFYDEEEHCWCVDAWQSPDGNDEGEVVAKYYDRTGEVKFLNPKARNDPQVQEALKERITTDIR